MEKIRIGLFGFGKTGKLVAHEFMNSERFDVRWVVKRRLSDTEKYASRLLGFESDMGRIVSISRMTETFFSENPVDILVDFSSKKGYRHYIGAAGQGIKIISAISRYKPEDLEALEAMSKQTALLYSPNITLGINFVMVASQVLQKIAPHADIEIIEEHFRKKKEVSGTAVKIAKTLGLESERHINSIRVGGVVGKHEIIFGLPNQTIRLTHESISRAAFGQGAIFAAKWLADKPPGLYSMEQIVTDMVGKNMPIF